MNAYVSGGAGFIGSHLVQRLLADGHDVNIRDDFSSSVWSGHDLTLLLAGHPHSNWSEGKVQYQDYFGAPDVIFHLASPVGPAGILPYAGRIASEIVSATMTVIGVALKNKCRLVYVSTSEIYGGGVNGLCKEDTPCIVPMSKPSARLEYAIGKMAGEMAVLNTPGLDAVIIRPFNVAGPRQSSRGGFVLPRFVQQGLAGVPLTVFGDGSQVRAFTHVDDIVDGLILASTKGVSGEAYNLGNPANKTTILELAAKVMQSMDAVSDVVFVDGKSIYGPLYAEASDKYPDASKAMAQLGWEPSRSIEATIQDVIKYERTALHEH